MKLEHRDNCVLVKYIPDRDESDGMFDPGTGNIYIAEKLSPLVREVTYYHELSHKEYYRRDKDWSSSDYLDEYRAMKGALLKVIARSSKLLNRVYLRTIQADLKRYRSNLKLWRPHLSALRRLMRTKLYKDFVRHNG